jgi:hypothetical protein
MQKVVAVMLLAMLAGCGGDEEGQAARQQSVLLGSSVQTGAPAAGEISVAGFRSDYTVARDAGGTVTLTNKMTGKATAYDGLALVKFADTYVSFDLDGGAGQVYRLYQAAFDRQPDAAGLGFWIKANHDGHDLIDIAGNFISSAEFIRLYGDNLPAASFIDHMYQNVLHRAGDPGGASWWTTQVNNGADRRGVLFGFSDSAENRTKLLPGIANGFDYIPFGLAAEEAPTSAQKCTPDEYMDVAAVGKFAVINNMWNASSVPAASQCVSYTTYGTVGVQAAQFKWSYKTTDFSIHAYPEILYGQRQGTQASTTASLPHRVLDLHSAKVTANVSTTCDAGSDCHFDTAFDLWFQEENTPTYFKPSLELMVITETNWMTDPAIYREPVVATVTIGGAAFDLHYRTMTVAGVGSWPYLAYVSRTPLKALNLDLNDFIKDAQARSYLRSTNFLSTVEFGTEVVYGSGSTAISNYTLEVL